MALYDIKNNQGYQNAMGAINGTIGGKAAMGGGGGGIAPQQQGGGNLVSGMSGAMTGFKAGEMLYPGWGGMIGAAGGFLSGGLGLF